MWEVVTRADVGCCRSGSHQLWSEIVWSRRRDRAEQAHVNTVVRSQEQDFLDALLPTVRKSVKYVVGLQDVSNDVIGLGKHIEMGRCASGEDIPHTLVLSVHIQWIPSR